MTHNRSLLLLALTAVLWSIGGLLIKSVSLHPLAIAGARSGIAAIVMTLATRKLRFIWTRAQWAAAICLALTVLLFVSATKLTTAANAVLLQYTAPIYAAVFGSWLLKERVVRRDWIALAVVMCGMLLFFVGQLSPEHLLGNLIALLSGFSFAGIAVFLRMQKGQSTIETLILGHVLSAVIGLPFCFLGPIPSTRDLSLLAILGIFQLGIPYVLYGIAIRHVTALEATLIPVLEPILNPVWVALFIGEIPGPTAFAGGVVVVSAILIHSYLGVRRKPIVVVG